MALYHGEELDFIPTYNGGDADDFHKDAALWIRKPSQRNLPYMKFVGGFPNEWCVTLRDLPKSELLKIIEDNPKNRALVMCCEQRLLEQEK